MICKSLSLRFPADTTSAAGTDCLRIIDNTKRAANQLGGKVDRRTVQKGQRDRVYDDTRPSHEGMFKLALRTFLSLRLKFRGGQWIMSVLVLWSALPS
jgi:hypothetical protein